MQATDNLDAVYLTTLLGELGQISNEMNKAQAADLMEGLGLYYQAKTRLDQLRVRISRDVSDMQEQEATEVAY